MKILVLCVINSSRHRKCFVRAFIHSLFVSKSLTRSVHCLGRRYTFPGFFHPLVFSGLHVDGSSLYNRVDVYIVYVIESAAYSCQKPERARNERVRVFDTNNE